MEASQETCHSHLLIFYSRGQEYINVQVLLYNRMSRMIKKLYLLVALGALLSLLYPCTAMGRSVVFERSPLFDNLKPGEKGAILMVHFGTTHDDTRAKTIDAINAQVANAFPSLEVREAYTSRIVNKRLGDRGIIKLNPRQALEKLREDGFTHVLVQASILVNGLEMTSLQYDVEAALGGFKVLRLSTSLLFYEADYEPFLDVMTKGAQDDTAYLWVGHGTYDVSTAQYAMLDHLLYSRGYANVMAGCVEGYPYYEQALERLKATRLKKVVLQPLMVVAGEHAKEDIVQEWKPRLEALGYDVEVRLVGLGELASIQKIIVDKITFYTQNRRLGIMEKKEVYEVTGEKMHADEE